LRIYAKPLASPLNLLCRLLYGIEKYRMFSRFRTRRERRGLQSLRHVGRVAELGALGRFARTPMKQLSEAEYLATVEVPMKRLAADAEPPFELWDYFDAIPQSDFEGHDCSAGSVTYVWEHPTGRYQHVLVSSEDKNVLMVLVLNIVRRSVFGHRLLDLNNEYGLTRN
jgi:hypothetical protein